jgi:hypothetical protein
VTMNATVSYDRLNARENCARPPAMRLKPQNASTGSRLLAEALVFAEEFGRGEGWGHGP